MVNNFVLGGLEDWENYGMRILIINFLENKIPHIVPILVDMLLVHRLIENLRKYLSIYFKVLI